MSLVAFLIRKHNLTREQAEFRARKIYDSRREQTVKKHARLSKAQLTMQFDAGDPGEEPIHRREPDASLPF
ncbi:MAG: hypothetical protein U1E51_26325 [Candidatus Binatia bacterium]|nr:hypothetical protein [Candidatus Binatia bacterium]